MSSNAATSSSPRRLFCRPQHAHALPDARPIAMQEIEVLGAIDDEGVAAFDTPILRQHLLCVGDDPLHVLERQQEQHHPERQLIGPPERHRVRQHVARRIARPRQGRALAEGIGQRREEARLVARFDLLEHRAQRRRQIALQHAGLLFARAHDDAPVGVRPAIREKQIAERAHFGAGLHEPAFEALAPRQAGEGRLQLLGRTDEPRRTLGAGEPRIDTLGATAREPLHEVHDQVVAGAAAQLGAAEPCEEQQRPGDGNADAEEEPGAQAADGARARAGSGGRRRRPDRGGGRVVAFALLRRCLRGFAHSPTLQPRPAGAKCRSAALPLVLPALPLPCLSHCLSHCLERELAKTNHQPGCGQRPRSPANSRA
jgi:hypothetical protein